jgi:site-specific DNA-cytosine methylase
MNGMNKIVVRGKRTTKQVIMIQDQKYQKFEVVENNNIIGVTRYQLSMHSDTGMETPYSYPHGKSRPLCAGGGGGFSIGMLIDRRVGNKDQFLFRYFTHVEKERLFGFQDNYTNMLSKNQRNNVLGNSISVHVVNYILGHLIYSFS